ncbi:nucleoid-associated protein [Viscerimonas tarda]
MKTHFRIFLISVFFIGSLTGVVYGNVPVDSTSLVQVANKTVAKWTSDVQLTTEQQAQLREKIMEYLINRQAVFGNEDKPARLSNEQKTSLKGIGDTYRGGIETILTEEQKVIVETKKEERKAEAKEKATNAVNEELSKSK